MMNDEKISLPVSFKGSAAVSTSSCQNPLLLFLLSLPTVRAKVAAQSMIVHVNNVDKN